MRVLIVGCGYVGLPLGAQLVRQGHEVFGLRRTSSAAAEIKRAGITPLIADISKKAELQKLPGAFDWVVNTVSSTKGGIDEYREVYLQGMRNLIDWLVPAPPQKFVYTSSTSVYGQTNGSLVDEASPTTPASETSQILVQAEQVLLEAAAKQHSGPSFPAVILRVAGIYGPGRGYWLQQYVRGEAKTTGDGERLLNMIHRDDLVGIIIAALEHGRAGEIYNAVDDEPVRQIDLFRWLGATVRRAMPPTEGEPSAGKRVLTSKRVSNRRLKTEFGYQFQYPTFREGFSALALDLPGHRVG